MCSALLLLLTTPVVKNEPEEFRLEITSPAGGQTSTSATARRGWNQALPVVLAQLWIHGQRSTGCGPKESSVRTGCLSSAPSQAHAATSGPGPRRPSRTTRARRGIGLPGSGGAGKGAAHCPRRARIPETARRSISNPGASRKARAPTRCRRPVQQVHEPDERAVVRPAALDPDVAGLHPLPRRKRSLAMPFQIGVTPARLDARPAPRSWEEARHPMQCG